ncbi:MAG: hypothetical protein AVDCRST_MAG19-757, partial [uncultured Thermomicrobiales bacterium]
AHHRRDRIDGRRDRRGRATGGARGDRVGPPASEGRRAAARGERCAVVGNVSTRRRRRRYALGRRRRPPRGRGRRRRAPQPPLRGRRAGHRQRLAARQHGAGRAVVV